MTTMTSRERIDTAIRLGKPDRVPVVPMIDSFAARYAGISQHDMLFNIRRSDQAFLRVHRDLGPIDGFNFSNAGLARLMESLTVVPPILPGVDGVDDNALWQFLEKTVMKPEEYGSLAANPNAFLRDRAIELRPGLSGMPEYYYRKALGFLDVFRVFISCRLWRHRGIEPMVGANNVLFPLEQISTMLRSYADFVTDLYRRGDEVKKASHAMLKTWYPLCVVGPYVSGIRRALIGLTRTSASLLSPRQFEEFALEDLLELCNYLVRFGVTPVLHLDNDWTPFLHYFKELPRGKCVCNLDGTSDIFAAREILGGHMCIMGDVPATLLKLSGPEEVEAYCESLITELGADGGFILSSGCDVPIDARPENVKAMLQSVGKFKA